MKIFLLMMTFFAFADAFAADYFFQNDRLEVKTNFTDKFQLIMKTGKCEYDFWGSMQMCQKLPEIIVEGSLKSHQPSQRQPDDLLSYDIDPKPIEWKPGKGIDSFIPASHLGKLEIISSDNRFASKIFVVLGRSGESTGLRLLKADDNGVTTESYYLPLVMVK